MTKCIDQSEVRIKNYKVKYANDSNRTSESGENTMDCSELVCRYLHKIEWSEKVMGGNTRILHDFGEKHSTYLTKHDNTTYKPQKGDIFIWKNSSGMGHTGVIIKYEEIQNKKGGTDEVVTTIEAISSTETPYDLNKNISMNGVIKLKWLRKSKHLLNHSLTNKKGHSVTPCRFYTPLIHYTKADKKIIWKGNSANFEIKNKN
ncbi:peptidoglycan amidohydrolase family protein [Apibacter adventoris]|uniref:peptidoglycan amidohydrolase family protein n=1 Tax=Apibacter adventoris TaxID=1679466 RepID=UPI001C8718FE|nr:CHAP domain-containing protein [Apibacter adventoris]